MNTIIELVPPTGYKVRYASYNPSEIETKYQFLTNAFPERVFLTFTKPDNHNAFDYIDLVIKMYQKDKTQRRFPEGLDAI